MYCTQRQSCDIGIQAKDIHLEKSYYQEMDAYANDVDQN